MKLDFFMENQIKALISYYLFTENLKQNINTSRIFNECYLIDESWMKNYANFFLYEEVIQQVINILNNSNNEKNVEKIFYQFDNNFLKKIKEKEKLGIKAITQLLSLFTKENFVESANIRDILKYMNHNKYYILTDIKKKEYLINEGRIFIKLCETSINKFEILICSYNLENNHLIPELLLK